MVFSSSPQTEFTVDSEECAQGQRHGSKPGISLQFDGPQLLLDSWANVRALFKNASLFEIDVICCGQSTLIPMLVAILCPTLKS